MNAREDVLYNDMHASVIDLKYDRKAKTCNIDIFLSLDKMWLIRIEKLPVIFLPFDMIYLTLFIMRKIYKRSFPFFIFDNKK